MTLPTARLGITDMEITRVGLGAWALGGGSWLYGWGSQDDKDSIATIRYALDQGVNWIDTAAVYGLGHSEQVVAQALKGVGDRPYVFTKCGMIWDDAWHVSRVARPDTIRREFEASLRRLEVERIDLYQVHWPPEDGTPIEEYWPTMVELKNEGKVRAVGLSNHNVAQLERAEKIGHVDSLQPPLSMINRTQAEEIAWCARNGTGVIVYSPMHSGLLTGKFSRERVESLPEDDWRRRSPDFTTDLDRNLALADALRPIADRHGVTQAAVAVAWTLAWPGVTGAIVGARNPQQVDDWLPAASLQLTQDDLEELAAAIERTGAGQGPVRPLSP
jgi:aryl-alcohol dehydrogenase-like predicted oxidoreductase